MDLRKWLLGIYPLAATKKTLSGAEPARQLGIAPQTVGTMRHKITYSMAGRKGRKEERLLHGLVEMDPSCFG